MADPRVTEKDFLQQVLSLAQLKGWLTAHFRPAMNTRGQWMTAVQGDGAGFPDLVLVRPPEILFVELKGPKGRLSEAQRVWLIKLGECQSESMTVHVWKPADWDSIVEVLS